MPASAAESASSFNTLAQRVSQAFGLGLLNAFLTVAGAQSLADRSGLLGAYGADPRISALEQDPAGLFGLYQRTAGIAQADAYGRAFFVIGLLCFAGALLALFLQSGKPTSGSSAMAH